MSNSEEKKSSIPTTKVARAARFARTGLKVGGNYLKHHIKKAATGDADKNQLDKANAEAIYDTLSTLKGSALKAAQMLSMDQNVLPAPFIEKFTEAQYQAPALSGPLVVKTFRKYLGKSPLEIFDEFEMEAVHAASIGQVHRAQIDGESLAIKIQYPGVGDSVVSDLNLVRPIARRMMGWKDKDLDIYFEEVKARLVEETDYELELQRGVELGQAVAALEDVATPHYFPEYSGPRILAMRWMDGSHLDSFLAQKPDQQTRDRAGQALWDFYNFQVHQLQKTHADAHPGNFLFMPDGRVGVLDFGCIKEVPDSFYRPYAKLLNPETLENEAELIEAGIASGILLESDNEKDQGFFMDLLRQTLSILCKPFHQELFDFGEKSYLDSIYAYGEQMAKDPTLRKIQQPRGSQHGIYLNRAYFGLYMILNKLGARVDTRRWMPEM
jgi:predicted unusual protein kinase regulating ubiquinone biosynthesis (AarF/ABC1/UbiB family)